MNPLNSQESGVADPAAVPTPGRMLRAAREAQGMHLAMLSVTLKVPTKQLEALENDQYDAFRGPAYVRAVAQSVCRHLGVDPGPVLAGLPRTAASMAVRPGVAQAPLQVSPRRGRPGAVAGVSRQVLLLGALMLAGSAALIWWPMPTPVSASGPETAASPSSIALASASETLQPSPQTPASDSRPPPDLTPAPPGSASASPAVSLSAAMPTPPRASSALPAPTPVPPGATPSPLVIAASGDTWLEVRDARGQLVVNRLLKGGETQTVELSPPFNVVIGRAHLVRVTLGDKDFDLTPHTKVSTARFDIQP